MANLRRLEVLLNRLARLELALDAGKIAAAAQYLEKERAATLRIRAGMQRNEETSNNTLAELFDEQLEGYALAIGQLRTLLAAFGATGG